MKHDIVLEGKRIPYAIRVSPRARYLRMTVGLTEGLVVTVPNHWSERFVESFLRQKSRWVLKHTERMKKFSGKTVLSHDRDDFVAHKKEALDKITERVEFFNSLYQFSYNRISVRNQTSVWGSCSYKGNLQFNYKLMHVPQKTMDYVVVHELCHLREHNHSARFWKLVAKTFPDYKTIRRSLHGYVMM